jgi:hypothetical protein
MGPLEVGPDQVLEQAAARPEVHEPARDQADGIETPEQFAEAEGTVGCDWASIGDRPNRRYHRQPER